MVTPVTGSGAQTSDYAYATPNHPAVSQLNRDIRALYAQDHGALRVFDAARQPVDALPALAKELGYTSVEDLAQGYQTYLNDFKFQPSADQLNGFTENRRSIQMAEQVSQQQKRIETYSQKVIQLYGKGKTDLMELTAEDTAKLTDPQKKALFMAYVMVELPNAGVYQGLDAGKDGGSVNTFTQRINYLSDVLESNSALKGQFDYAKVKHELLFDSDGFENQLTGAVQKAVDIVSRIDAQTYQAMEARYGIHGIANMMKAPQTEGLNADEVQVVQRFKELQDLWKSHDADPALQAILSDVAFTDLQALEEKANGVVESSEQVLEQGPTPESASTFINSVKGLNDPAMQQLNKNVVVLKARIDKVLAEGLLNGVPINAEQRTLLERARDKINQVQGVVDQATEKGYEATQACHYFAVQTNNVELLHDLCEVGIILQSYVASDNQALQDKYTQLQTQMETDVQMLESQSALESGTEEKNSFTSQFGQSLMGLFGIEDESSRAEQRQQTQRNADKINYQRGEEKRAADALKRQMGDYLV